MNQKYWNGLGEKHPLIVSLDKNLAKFGYARVKSNLAKTVWADWSQRFLSDVDLFIQIQSNSVSEDVISFQVVIQLKSHRLMQIENAIKIWECGNPFMLLSEEPASLPSLIQMAGLNALMVNSSPSRPGIMRVSTIDAAETVVDAVMRDYVFFAQPFIDSLNSFEKLYESMTQPANYLFRKSTMPFAEDARSHIVAFLCHISGNNSAAIDAIDTGEIIAVAAAEQDFPGQNNAAKRSEWHKVIRCKANRYRQFFLNEISQKNKSQNRQRMN